MFTEIVWVAVQLPRKDNKKNLKCGERNVDLSMGRLDWLDGIRATWGSHAEVEFLCEQFAKDGTFQCVLAVM
jgi:hypothetical protein